FATHDCDSLAVLPPPTRNSATGGFGVAQRSPTSRGRYGVRMFGLLLVAVSLGLSNFAASIGIGVGKVDRRTRLRVGVIFGIFGTGMPILGLLLGRDLARTLGHAAHWVGGALLIATGGYAIFQAIRSPGREKSSQASEPVAQSLSRLLITGLALSVDNLAV